MLYTIQQIPNQPIYIVRILPPLNSAKQIYAIDAELLRLTAHHSGRACRIDDFTHLHPHQFTRSDALAWFGGAVREDAQWRSHIAHVAVAKPRLRQMVADLVAAGHPTYVPVLPRMEAALSVALREVNHSRAELD